MFITSEAWFRNSLFGGLPAVVKLGILILIEVIVYSMLYFLVQQRGCVYWVFYFEASFNNVISYLPLLKGVCCQLTIECINKLQR